MTPRVVGRIAELAEMDSFSLKTVLARSGGLCREAGIKYDWRWLCGAVLLLQNRGKSLYLHGLTYRRCSSDG